MAQAGPDKELQAIDALIKALSPLNDDEQARVLEYVMNRLGFPYAFASRSSVPSTVTVDTELPTAIEMMREAQGVTDIKALKQEKDPKSANQMAALVAYYLSDVAPIAERKKAIGSADVEKYFKQARFPLPKRPDMTLPNAANAGYFDFAGQGQYRLNPVGYNLVAHGLPASGGEAPRAKPKKKPKKPGASSGRKRNPR